MPWSAKNRTRTYLLVILGVVVLVQGLAFYLREVPSSPSSIPRDMDFLLEVGLEPGAGFSKSASPELPLFDPNSETWSLNGALVHEFANLIQGLELGPHGTSPYVVIALPDNSTIGDYRSAVASLSSWGICRFGVFSPLSTNEPVSQRSRESQSREVFVPVYQILAVKRGAGTARACIDRFPPWSSGPS